MKKIEKIIMACLAMFPFAFIVLFFIARIGQGTAQFSTISDAWQNIYTWSEGIKASMISEPLQDMIEYFGTTESPGMQAYLANIMSYEALLLMIHIAYDVIVFLPKICYSAWDKLERRTTK